MTNLENERDMWQARANDAEPEVQRLRDVKRKLEGEITLRSRVNALDHTLRRVLASAFPHHHEHPTMHAAWRAAEKVLGIPREQSTARPCACGDDK